MSDSPPSGIDPTEEGNRFDERYWKRFGAHARKRASMLGALILCPWGIFILAMKIFEPMDYSAGDIRNSMVYRLSVYGLLIILLLAAMVYSIRWLLADNHRP